LLKFFKKKVLLVKTEGTIKNGLSRDTGNIGHKRHRTKTNKTKNKQKTNKIVNADPTKKRICGKLEPDFIDLQPLSGTLKTKIFKWPV
jgi:hypothetical protein